MIQNAIISFFELLGKKLKTNVEYKLNAVDSVFANTICFAENETFLTKALNNINCEIILTNLQSPSNDRIVNVENPRITYFNLYNIIAELHLKEFNFNTIIGENSQINSDAMVAKYGVIIGNNCVIHAGAIVLSGAIIGNNCTIHAGAVIASEGFEVKQTLNASITVVHDGKAILGNNVSVGSNSSIDRGFKLSDTLIGDYTRIDSLVKISHGVKVGTNSLIISNAYIAGAAVIGNQVYIGPNSAIAAVNIGDNAYITMGSVVVSNVKSAQKVSGNFAINHSDNLIIHQNKLREIRKLKNSK